jgi:hypothetical protein
MNFLARIKKERMWQNETPVSNEGELEETFVTPVKKALEEIKNSGMMYRDGSYFDYTFDGSDFWQPQFSFKIKGGEVNGKYFIKFIPRSDKSILTILYEPNRIVRRNWFETTEQLLRDMSKNLKPSLKTLDPD